MGDVKRDPKQSATDRRKYLPMTSSDKINVNCNVSPRIKDSNRISDIEKILRTIPLMLRRNSGQISRSRRNSKGSNPTDDEFRQAREKFNTNARRAKSYGFRVKRTTLIDTFVGCCFSCSRTEVQDDTMALSSAMNSAQLHPNRVDYDC